jgi:hypothetical protein
VSATEGQLPSTEAQILALGWEHGAPDQMTPAIRQRLVACGLPLHVAGMTRQQQDEPLDAA